MENLDYLPLYELGRINRQLNLLVDRVMRWAVVAVVITLVTCVFMLLISWLFVFSGVIGMIVVSFPLARFGRRILILADRRSKAEKAKGREPDEESPKDETIGWWEIQRAGFDASVYKEALVDRGFRVAGQASQGTTARGPRNSSVLLPPRNNIETATLHSDRRILPIDRALRTCAEPLRPGCGTRQLRSPCAEEHAAEPRSAAKGVACCAQDHSRCGCYRRVSFAAQIFGTLQGMPDRLSAIASSRGNGIGAGWKATSDR